MYEPVPADQLKKGDVVLVHGRVSIVTSVTIHENYVQVETMNPRTGREDTRGSYPRTAKWHRSKRLT